MPIRFTICSSTCVLNWIVAEDRSKSVDLPSHPESEAAALILVAERKNIVAHHHDDYPSHFYIPLRPVGGKMLHMWDYKHQMVYERFGHISIRLFVEKKGSKKVLEEEKLKKAINEDPWFWHGASISATVRWMCIENSRVLAISHTLLPTGVGNAVAAS